MIETLNISNVIEKNTHANYIYATVAFALEGDTLLPKADIDSIIRSFRVLEFDLKKSAVDWNTKRSPNPSLLKA